jgi:hypothetical protein
MDQGRQLVKPDLGKVLATQQLQYRPIEFASPRSLPADADAYASSPSAVPHHPPVKISPAPEASQPEPVNQSGTLATFVAEWKDAVASELSTDSASLSADSGGGDSSSSGGDSSPSE